MSVYRTELQCFPVSSHPGRTREDVENGGKLLLPPSVLDSLSRLNISYPLLFRLINCFTNQVTHCGVLEFVSDEGTIVAPTWVMEHLCLNIGDKVMIETTSLPVATYSRFQPQSTDFLDISNPKAVLENTLRNFSCLTTGDVLALKYNKRVYKLKVQETRPENAVEIIECDMNVDFSPPVGYVERLKGEENSLNNTETESAAKQSSNFKPFCGQGRRLDGKCQKFDTQDGSVNDDDHIPSQGIPDYEYRIGNIEFFRNVPCSSNNNNRKSGKSNPGNSNENKENDTP